MALYQPPTMALHGFLAGLHHPFLLPHEGYTSASTLRETALLWQPSSRAAPDTLSACRPWHTLRADSTTSRREAFFVVASSFSSSALVPHVHPAKASCQRSGPFSSCRLGFQTAVPPRLESLVSREFLPRAARGNCLHSVLSLPSRAARVGVTFALSLCTVALAGSDLHGLAMFLPPVPDWRCFRVPLEWLTSKLAVRRCVMNPLLHLPMPSTPP